MRRNAQTRTAQWRELGEGIGPREAVLSIGVRGRVKDIAAAIPILSARVILFFEGRLFRTGLLTQANSSG